MAGVHCKEIVMAAYFTRSTLCLQLTVVYDPHAYERTPIRTIKTIVDVEVDARGALPDSDWLGSSVEIKYLPLPSEPKFTGCYAHGKPLYQWVEDGIVWREQAANDGMVQGVPVRGTLNL
jgi:hypothetical protein